MANISKFGPVAVRMYSALREEYPLYGPENFTDVENLVGEITNSPEPTSVTCVGLLELIAIHVLLSPNPH